MKKTLVRIDGRIDALYRNYKVRSRMFFMNLLIFVLAAIPFLASLFTNVSNPALLSAVVFYICCSIGNLFRLLPISRDIRLLDDMRPLHSYFAGILISVLCSLFLLVLFLPGFLGLSVWPENLLHIGGIIGQALYLIGIVLITFSGCRKQEFYT